MLEELKQILSNLYASHGLTEDIIRLSQVIDILIYQEQIKRGIYEKQIESKSA